jgi:hypothetical protein
MNANIKSTRCEVPYIIHWGQNTSSVYNFEKRQIKIVDLVKVIFPKNIVSNVPDLR